MMIKTLKTLLVAVAVMATASIAEASEPQAVAPNYELAERFSPKKMARLVPQTIVRPNWFEKSNKFWYSWQTVDNINYYIVDPASGKKSLMWEMGDLAKRVTEMTKYPFDAQHLPIENIKLKEDNVVLFDIAPHKVKIGRAHV